MATVFDVAKYFLSRQDEEAGDTISNMKLQKLVYYAQGFTIAITGKPLFMETIEAWEHGPVVPELYRKYKTYAANSIPSPDDAPETIAKPFDTEQLEILNEVYDVYGQYSAWKLRNFTHDEAPWLERFNKDDHTITHEDMCNYFVSLVKCDED